jgi:peptidyl-prolyl cis-trans isomerase SurA
MTGSMLPMSRALSLLPGAALALMLAAIPLMAAGAEDGGAPPPAGMKPTTAEQSPGTKVKRAEKKTAKASPADSPAKTHTKSSGRSSAAGEQSIAVLVNDEPITGYEIQQRALMLSGGSIGPKAQEIFKNMLKAPSTTERLKAILQEVIKANPGKTKDQLLAIFEQRKKDFALSMQKQAIESAKATALPGVRKQALDELIDERLKLQEAKRLNAVVTDEDVDRVIDGIATQNKMTKQQLAQQVGGSLDAMKNRIRSSLSFNEVVRRKFGHTIAINGKDLDRFVSTAKGEDQVELQVQRVQIAMPAALDQAGVAQRVQEAEKIRAKFTDCKSLPGLVKGIAGAKLDSISKRQPSAFTEPTKSMLLAAKDGEMLPPTIGEGGVELYAVCGRDVVKADDAKRNQAEGELKQKEFELLSKKHLKDLRTDAHIEYR